MQAAAASSARADAESSAFYLELGDGSSGATPTSLSPPAAAAASKRIQQYRALLLASALVVLALLITVIALIVSLHSAVDRSVGPSPPALASTGGSSSGTSLRSSSSSSAPSSPASPTSYRSTSPCPSVSSSLAPTSPAVTSPLPPSPSAWSTSTPPSSPTSPPTPPPTSTSTFPSSSSSPPPSSPSPSPFPSSSSSPPPFIPSIPYPTPLPPSLLSALSDELDSTRDVTADPCADWFQYACGGWVARTRLQPNQSNIIKGVADATAANERVIDGIIDQRWPVLTPLYESCMDTGTIERLGLTPITPLLTSLYPYHSPPYVTDMRGVFREMGRLRAQLGLSLALTLGFVVLTNDPTRNVLQLSVGGGWTVPGVNNYLGPGNISALITERVAQVLQAAGDGEEAAQAQAKAIVGFETDLYRVVNGQYLGGGGEEIGRDGEGEGEGEGVGEPMAGTYTLANLLARAPAVPLMEWFNASGVLSSLQQAGMPSIYTTDEALLTPLNRLIASTPHTSVLAWVRWQALNASLPYLALPLRLAHLRAFLTPLYGVTALPDRHPHCRDIVSSSLADLVGRYFVTQSLPPTTRASATQLLHWVRAAFDSNLPSLEWMDDATRALAGVKAQAVLELLGGPGNETWSDYSGMGELSAMELYANVRRVAAFNTGVEWSRLVRRNTRARWSMQATTVNAAYSRTANSIMLPAGILQRPWFDAEYPMALNLARIGMMMGHELTHGFDSNGRLYDGAGNRRDWFNAATAARFNERAACFVRQYGGVVVQNCSVDGALTLAENIADNGGLHLAHAAYEWYRGQLQGMGWSEPSIPSPRLHAPLTGEQLFYWAYAQSWCSVATDAFIAHQVRSDAHAPAQTRVWAVLRNQPGFAAAFNCPVGSRMNPSRNTTCELY